MRVWAGGMQAEAEGKVAARRARRLPLSPYDALFQSPGSDMTQRNDSGRTQTGAASLSVPALSIPLTLKVAARPYERKTGTETGRKGTTDSEVGEEVECQGPIDTAHEELVSDALFQTRHQSIVLFQY